MSIKKSVDTLDRCVVQAIDKYQEVIKRYPQLIGGKRKRRICTDREKMVQFALEKGESVGIVGENPFFYYIADLIEITLPSGEISRQSFFRMVGKGYLQGLPGVVVVAVIKDPQDIAKDRFVLVQLERHASGEARWEFPRGFGEVGQSGGETALQELQEETGFRGEQAAFLGELEVESALFFGSLRYYYIPVTGAGRARPGAEESIFATQTVTLERLWEKIASGEITDSATLQGLALYARYLALKSRMDK
ncbi:NUDIX hydrolase [Magnetococcales bacterium HHB-1]